MSHMTLKKEGVMPRGLSATHMMIFEQIKNHLEDYKTISEIVAIVRLSRPLVMQRLLLLEDKKLIVSKLVKTPIKRGSTKAYKLVV